MPILRERLTTSRVPCVVLALLLLCNIASAFEAGADHANAKPRNIVQACRGQLEDLCDVHEVERVQCLLENYPTITSTVCREWLSARSVCMAFVERRSKEVPECSVHDHRRCIRKTPKAQLPVACRASDYYESLFIHKPRKFVVDNDDL